MGTNYYVKTKECPTCHHKPEEIHLGKSSAGWRFSFQYNGGRFYKTVKEMKMWLKDKEIKNEYGEDVSYKSFLQMVAQKQKHKLAHAEYVKENYPTHTDSFMIGEYSFTNADFS